MSKRATDLLNRGNDEYRSFRLVEQPVRRGAEERPAQWSFAVMADHDHRCIDVISDRDETVDRPRGNVSDQHNVDTIAATPGVRLLS